MEDHAGSFIKALRELLLENQASKHDYTFIIETLEKIQVLREKIAYDPKSCSYRENRKARIR